MKLTDKYSPAQLKAPAWDLYDQCSATIGLILDNKFKDPHISVYEHVRHTPSEVFRHSEELGNSRLPSNANTTGLAPEESNVLDALVAPEVGRRLNVVGDVGVGKTTFIKHLSAVHLNTPEYSRTSPIYIDFADFNASLTDPILDIRRKFVDTVWAALEKLFGLEELRRTDDIVYEKGDLFATARTIAHRLPESLRAAHITGAMQEALKSNSVKFTIERLNVLCEVDVNRLLLVVDNIDHLPDAVLRTLSGFLLEIQLDASPMLLVCMRDHTYLSGFSSYQEEKTVPAWYIRLKPPNLRMMLDRRIAYFFPPEPLDGDSKTVSTGSGILRKDRSLANVCRALLKSPFSDERTYEFLCAYTNYNIRDLFRNLQHIVGFFGYRGYDHAFFLSDDPKIPIRIDECLISLGLRDSFLFFPSCSPIFNPYSAGADKNSLDKIVAGRILQMLDNRMDWVPLKELKKALVDWGYAAQSIDCQIGAMLNKDIIWASTGSPQNLTVDSGLRLSYRGQLYARKILQRAVFNYMMSFDVEAPTPEHAVLRDHASEFRPELAAFANFTASFESDSLAFRVLGLAEIVFEAESIEVRQLLKKHDMAGFKRSVAPSSLSVGIVDGLKKFLRKCNEMNGNCWRFMPPTTATLRDVGERYEQYRQAFVDVYK